MPKRWYKVRLTLFDPDGAELASSTQDERYADDAEATRKFGEKDQAARNAGKGSPGDDADDE
jgi:hypothetical protein